MIQNVCVAAIIAALSFAGGAATASSLEADAPSFQLRGLTQESVGSSRQASGLQVRPNPAPPGSHVLSLNGLALPEISVDPTSVNASQTVGQFEDFTLTITNSGNADLEWEISEAPLALKLALDHDGAKAAEGGNNFELVLDDGSGENAIGVGGVQFLWFNRFTPQTDNFPITINEVQVMFGYPSSAGGISVGQLVDIYLFEDADGNPANGAIHRATLNNAAVQAVNGNDWSTYPIDPTTFHGPGDIIIAVVNRTAGVTVSTFPAVIDQSSPPQQRSWVGFGAVPADPPDFTAFPNFGIIDSFGALFAGNWLVRGYGTGLVPCNNPDDVTWLSVSPGIGTTSPGAESQVTVTLNSTGLSVGEHSSLLCLESNDPTQPLIEIPISLEVTAPIIELNPLSLTAGQVGAAYSDAVTAAGQGAAAPFSFGWSGDIPAGLAINAESGQITGAPTAAGTFNVTVTATDSSDVSLGGPFEGSQAYTIVIAPPDIGVSPQLLPVAVLGQAYSTQLVASGNGATEPFTFSHAAGVLPDGVSLSSEGVVAGTPLETGNFSFSVTAIDSTDASSGGPFSGTATITLSVVADGVFIFFDSFEAIDPLAQLVMEPNSSKRFALPLLNRLGKGEVDELALAEVVMNEQRIGMITTRCGEQDCELRVYSLHEQKAEAYWWPITSEPFGIELKVDNEGRMQAHPVR